MPEVQARRAARRRPVLEAAVASAGMVVFAVFVRSALCPIAGVGVLFVAVALFLSFRREPSLRSVLGLPRVSPKVAAWLPVGVALGVGCGILLRVVREGAPLPGALTEFAVVAAAVGAAEELLYRGYVQGRLERLGWPMAVTLAAAAHTAYKVALFAWVPAGVTVDLGFLGTWTLIGGIVFGLTRQFSGSVLPALAAHVLFDIVVYGDWAQAPWWVWG